MSNRMTDNIIVGSWLKSNNPPQTLKDVEDSINQVRLLHVQELVSKLAGDVFDGLSVAGFDNDEDPVYTKDLALIAEGIRSYILKHQNQYHPLQEVAESMFDWDGEDRLKTAESIEITFQTDL